MKKDQNHTQKTYYYDNKGVEQVSEQIMDAYNSGVIDQTNGRLMQEDETDSLS